MINDQNRIWSYFQTERIDVFSRSTPRLRFLAVEARKLINSKSPSALNIGVGNGFLENFLLCEGWRVKSIDPSENAIKKLHEKGIEAEVGSIELLPYECETFNVVFCSEVLEHLSNEQIEQGLKEVSRVLKAGGYLLGTVPFQENLDENMVICPDCGKVFHKWGHRQQFDVEKLVSIFPETLRVLIVKLKLFIHWEGLSFKRKVAAYLKLLLFHFGSHGSNETLYFLTKKT